jgi:hypothetical protein
MTSLADIIGIQSNGIAGPTLATFDLARARISRWCISGFRPFVDEAGQVCLWRGSQRRHGAVCGGIEGSVLTIPRKKHQFAESAAHETSLTIMNGGIMQAQLITYHLTDISQTEYLEQMVEPDAPVLAKVPGLI